MPDRLATLLDRQTADVPEGLHPSATRAWLLDQSIIESALRNSPPFSATMRERIDALRAWAKDRCVPAR